jgi:hypothetical protein
MLKDRRRGGEVGKSGQDDRIDRITSFEIYLERVQRAGRHQCEGRGDVEKHGFASCLHFYHGSLETSRGRPITAYIRTARSKSVHED